MAVLENKTGFSGDLFPAHDPESRLYLVLVVRGTFDLVHREEVQIAKGQDPLCLEDEYLGEPGQSSIKYESDLALKKPGTDIVMLGTAYAPENKPTSQLMVELSVGQLTKRVVVYGDRVWSRRLGIVRQGKPKPFVKMPLVYERAFGGSDTSHANPAKHDWERRNPVGMGFSVQRPLDGLPLPNIEDPSNLIRKWSDRPIPQGFGFVARMWEPRVKFAGTYDEHWRKEQFPLLPEDFDVLYFQAAHPDLICKPHLQGDEPVRIVGAVPEGVLEFKLPSIAIGVAIHSRRGNPERQLASLDTVILRPDERKLNLVWRSTILCRRKIFDIERVVAFVLRLKTAVNMLREFARHGPESTA